MKNPRKVAALQGLFFWVFRQPEKGKLLIFAISAILRTWEKEKTLDR
jgi:hypothetical protein